MNWIKHLLWPNLPRVSEVAHDTWWQRRYHFLGDWSGADKNTLASRLPPPGSEHPKVDDYVVTAVDLHPDGAKQGQYIAFVSYEHRSKHRYF